jgi:hypothetical protein
MRDDVQPERDGPFAVRLRLEAAAALEESGERDAARALRRSHLHLRVVDGTASRPEAIMLRLDVERPDAAAPIRQLKAAEALSVAAAKQGCDLVGVEIAWPRFNRAAGF